MALDIDAILEAVGEAGPYQRRIYFLLCLPVIFVGAANMAYVFIAATPNYRCFIPGCDDTKYPVYDEPFLNFTIPWEEEKGTFSSCEQYKRKDSTNITTCSRNDFTQNKSSCQAGILFDKSVYESTLITEFNLTCGEKWEASADQAIYFGGMFVGALVFGVVADLYGRRKIILIGIVLMALSGVSIALAPNFFSFHALRFINAVSSAGLFQTSFILGLEFVGPSKRVMFGIIGEYFFALGEVLLGFAAWGIRSWRMLQIVISAPVVCFIFYYWVVPESVRWLQAKGRHAQVVATLENVARINKKTIPLNLLRHQLPELNDENEYNESDDLTVLISRQQKVTFLDVIKNPVLAVRALFMIFVWISTTLSYYGLSYNSIELSSSHEANKPFVNFMLSSLVEIPGYTVAWIGMEYFGRKCSLISSLCLSGSFCIATGYLNGFLLKLLVFLFGKCSITSAFAIIYVYTAEMFPTNARNTVIGICSMFARVGGMCAPFSAFLKNIYPPLPMVIFGVLSLLSSLMVFIMPETLNTKLPDTIVEALNIGKTGAVLDRRGSNVEGENSQVQEEEEHLLPEEVSENDTDLVT